MAKFTFKTVSITSAAEGAGQTITFATLDTTPGASESRNVGTLTVIPVVVVHMQGKRTAYVISTTTAQFVVQVSDSGDSLPINADIIVETFEQPTSTSNALTATTAKVRNYLNIRAANELLTDAQINEQIDSAVEQYSKDKARIGRFEVIGNGEHEIALPSNWVDRSSALLNISINAGDQTLDYLDSNNYFVETVDDTQRTINNATAAATSVTITTVANAGFFKDGEIVTVGDDDTTETNWVTSNGNATTGVVALKNALANTYDATPYMRKLDHVKFIAIEPTSSEYFVLEYTLPQSHTNTLDTIPGSDVEAVCHLAASYSADSIAALFGKSTSGSFDGDSVNQLDKVAAWQEIAKAQRQIYKDQLKIGDSAQRKPFLKVIDIDTEYSWRKQFLFHPRRLN